MVRQACTGAGLLDAIRSAVANLERHVDEINALNVFPVPDGDTGTNMLATVRAALDEAERLGRDAPADRIAAAVSHGALMGARGNSGVITSQILRGVAEGLAGKKRFNGLDLANALALGHEDRVRRRRQARRGHDPDGDPRVVGRGGRGRRAGRRDGVGPRGDSSRRPRSPSPGRRPSCRSCARPASSTRAARACSACSRARCSACAADRSRRCRSRRRPAPRRGTARGRAGVPPGRRRARGGCVRLRDGVHPARAAAATSLDVRAIQARLEALGNSVLVGGDGRMVKVHVHNERPDEIIAYGLSLGTLTRITVENLDTMADDVREARASEFVAEGDAAPRASAGNDAASGRQRRGRRRRPSGGRASTTQALPVAAVAEPSANGSHGPDAVEIDATLGPAIVAVVAGDGLEKVFLEFGADHIVRGGQTANPSTGELLRIARLARSREVILLPNNPNVRLAAEQAAQHLRRIDASSSSRPGTPPRASPRSSPTTRRSTRPRTSGR